MSAGPSTEWGKDVLEKLGRVMSDLVALNKKVDEQTTKLVTFQERAQPYFTNLDSVKGWLKLVGGIGILAIAASVWRFAELSNTATFHEKEITEVRQDLKGLVKSSAELTAMVRTLGKQSSDVPTARTDYSGHIYYHEFVGRIEGLSQKEIKLLDTTQEGQSKTERTFPLAKDVRVIVKGEPSKLQQLTPGMFALVIYDTHGKVEVIVQAEPPPAKPAR